MTIFCLKITKIIDLNYTMENVIPLKVTVPVIKITPHVLVTCKATVHLNVTE